jgi:GrpB-like predicted nucleotidyltransferase (UPF0157 family)
MAITLVPPSPLWRERFAQESQRLSEVLASLPYELHHIGSTAIDGIEAKPILDLLLLVESLGALDEREGALVAAGYEAKGEFGIPGRRYFRKDSPQGVRTHHLHGFERGSEAAVRHLAFRDYLNAHPAAAQQYGALKRRLASLHAHDSRAYVAGKDAFVEHHVALALAWLAGGSGGGPRGGTDA